METQEKSETSQGPGHGNFAEIRCAGDCGGLLCEASPGSIEPARLEIGCVKCGRMLRHGEWHGIQGRPDISIAVYRCPSCRSIYQKVFEGIGRYCKKCHTRRFIFLATNANSPVLFGSRAS